METGSIQVQKTGTPHTVRYTNSIDNVISINQKHVQLFIIIISIIYSRIICNKKQEQIKGEKGTTDISYFRDFI